MKACPTDALSREAITGAILVRPDDCIVCSDCVDACPFGVVSTHPETGIALICDLCGGHPACVKRCAPGAIVFSDTVSRQRTVREKIAVRNWKNRKPGKRDKADE
jgi:Fe-S-cluster-containing hydrogenase component 2